jgi:hypothetical protein
MTTLTINNIHELINKPISIYCKQWEGDCDVYGQAVITEFSKDKCNPIKVGDATGDGHYLEFAIINEKGEICIGDSDRPVQYELSDNGMTTIEVVKNDIKRTFSCTNGYNDLPFSVKGFANGIVLAIGKKKLLNRHYMKLIEAIADRHNVNYYIDFNDNTITLS